MAKRGFVVDSIEDAVRAVGKVAHLSRPACRRAFERRFDVTRMARNYVQVYSGLIRNSNQPRRFSGHRDSHEMEATAWPIQSHIS